MSEVITTAEAPSAIGTYSQAVKAGNVVYVSGQIPLVPETMKVLQADFKSQVRQVFDNLHAVIDAAGGSFPQVVKLTIYLTDMDNFAQVNEVMSDVWSAPYPARALIGVSQLPRDVAIEMDAIVVLE